MPDLLIADADRDALVGAGLLLGAAEGTATFQVVGSLQEATRLLHDQRRIFSRVLICGVPPAESGSLRTALAVMEARGTRVWWFDCHELLWTEGLRAQLREAGVEMRLPDPYRPETERTAGIVLSHLLETGAPRVVESERALRSAVSEARRVEMGGPDWLALVDAVEHDHRLVSGRAIRSALVRVWDTEAPLEEQARRLVALQRSREARVQRFLEELMGSARQDEELLTFDAEDFKELRYVRPRMFAEAARRVMHAEYVAARVERGWVYACRSPYRAGLDIPIAFLEHLFDLDSQVTGYPYRATVRVETGADVDERLMKVLEVTLEEERTGRRKAVQFPSLEEDLDL